GAKPRVLLLDDEQAVVRGLAFNLRRIADPVTATDGATALEVLRTQGPFAVVISDMRMPGMDGAQFLAAARDVSPDTVRLLLTGFSDVDAAVSAVNEGRVFRFLTKPCPPPVLISSVEMAVEQYRLITAEKEVLRETLAGSIKVLTQMLALIQPMAFGRASRVRQRAVEVCHVLGQDSWQVELAAMFSEIGCLMLPPDTARSYYSGRALTQPEQAMIDKIPELTDSLLSNIPRLEGVREILRSLRRADVDPPWGARLLRVIAELDALEVRGLDRATIVATLRSPPGRHDPEILGAMERLLRGPWSCDQFSGQLAPRLRQVTLLELPEGATLARDVMSITGQLLLARGFEMTPALREQLMLLSRHVEIQQPLWIIDQ
ncbi:MAG: response regulator, partial [Actinomycetota bacterium]